MPTQNATATLAGSGSLTSGPSRSTGGNVIVLDTTFDDGTTDGWTQTTAGVGTLTIGSGAAHDGQYGAQGNVPNATVDIANLKRSIGPARQAMISGWWRVPTEGASSSANVPFARLFSGAQRLADVYRQNIVAGANVYLRVVRAIGGTNYTFLSSGFRLALNTWVYVQFGWSLDGTPTLIINGTTYLGGANKQTDFYAASQIDTAYLGSQEIGNQGVWHTDTVQVQVSQSAAASLAGAGSLTATGTRVKPAAATLAGAGTLSAAGTRIKLGSAALTGAGTLAATGYATRYRTVTLAGGGTLTATGLANRRAAVNLAGASALTTTAFVRRQAAVVLAAQSVRTASRARQPRSRVRADDLDRRPDWSVVTTISALSTQYVKGVIRCACMSCHSS